MDCEGAYPLMARGGPVFAPDFVSPVTRVPDFESEVFHELESLKVDLCSKPNLLSNEDELDISVDELRIIADEDLVNQAMMEAFQKEREVDESSSYLPDNLSIPREDDRTLNGEEGSEQMSCLTPQETAVSSSSGAVTKTRKKRSKLQEKGKKKITHGQPVKFQDNVIAKLEELASFREKQKEDRASAQLHSLKDNCRKKKLAPFSSENLGRLRTLEFLVNPSKMKASNAREHLRIRYPEVILTVEVYDSRASLKKVQEIAVLGLQFLTELKDSIYCLTNVIMHKAGQSDPSGYFLIEDLFCNDMRDPNAVDYSKPILDWLKNSKEDAAAKWNHILSGKMKKHHKAIVGNQSFANTPTFRAVRMEKTRFCDLKFRIGAGYLYCHQGDCKHVIMIRDMRLIHPEDMQNRAAYPLLAHQAKFRIQKCSVCQVYKATKVCVDDKWAGENPCYFCDNCYYLLHYNEDGSLLYEQFLVYDYVQDL